VTGLRDRRARDVAEELGAGRRRFELEKLCGLGECRVGRDGAGSRRELPTARGKNCGHNSGDQAAQHGNTIPDNLPAAMPPALILVCHQIRSPDNLGAIARLMANFGLEQLVLSDPVTHDFRSAEKLAVGAEHLLQKLAVAQTLREALSRAVYAIGTSSRHVKGALEADVAMHRLKEHAARGPVALVLGGEKRGLSDDELELCHDVAVIATHEGQPSMNISQAAAVLLYLFARERIEATAEEGASGRTLQALEQKLQEALTAVEWLNPQAPQHALRELVRSLVRGKLTQREAEMWLSALEHVRRAGT
jgi:tRNA/rRNA methyltransferase